MLTYVRGDLVDAALSGKIDIMVHGCNCFCTMGNGIARDVHQKIPDAFKADKTTSPGDRTKLGKYTLAKITALNGKQVSIINGYTQFTYWDPKDMFYLSALRSVFASIGFAYNDPTRTEDLVIGIPLIGAGLARGNWRDISNAIEELNLSANGLKVVVFVKFEKDWNDIVVKSFPEEIGHIIFRDLTQDCSINYI